MSYLTVILLADAKTYLRVQDTASDTEITRMIKGALLHLENQTNHKFFAQSKTYTVEGGCIRVYDYPINSVTSPASSDDYTATVKGTYTLYETSKTSIELNIGYALADVPQDLLEVAYEILDLWFYAPESGKTLKDLSELSKTVIENYRRFYI